MWSPVSFICNDEVQHTAVSPGMTILDFLRRVKRLKGTKEGCREGDCGACTVLIGEWSDAYDRMIYKAVNSCITPLGIINEKHLVTIEGLNSYELSVIQKNFIEEGASQCGFCTPGFINSLTSYFLSHHNYNLNDAIDSVAGNICRCTGYSSVKRAIEHITASLTGSDDNLNHIERLIKAKIIPDYFRSIPLRLKELRHLKPEKLQKETNELRIAGGTDLMVRNWEGILNSDISFLADNRCENLIQLSAGKCIIDATASITDIINSPELNRIIPEINNYLLLFGSLQIRNRATLGGNIVNASPIADSVIFFLPFDPEVILSDGENDRIQCLSDFYAGYKILNKKENEIIKYLRFNLPPEKYQFSFEKVSRRTHLDIASVNSALYLETDKKGVISRINISAGGVAPYPVLLRKTAEFLTHKEINNSNLLEALNIMQSEISPISDVRGSERYKRLLLRQLIIAHFMKLHPYLVKMEEAAI